MRLPIRRGATLAAAAGLLACSDLTSVDAPELIDPTNLESPAGALALRAGAISRFAQGYVLQVRTSGLIADELMDANGAYQFDRRVMPTVFEPYPYSALSVARIDLVNAIGALRRNAPTPAARIAELYVLLGLAETMLAENMCTPLPVATIRGGTAVDAPELARDELLQLALAHADSGAALLAPTDAIGNLLKLARSRMLLDRNDVSGAAAAVAGVPQTYQYNVAYSGTISNQLNEIYVSIVTARAVTVADREGGNGVAFITGKDRRVVTQLVGPSALGIPVYNYAAISSQSAPITLAAGVEGGLLRAEAALRASDVTTWTNELNALRQTAISPAIAALTPDSTTTASADLRLTVQFRERALWLYGMGRRHGDMRRLVRQYGRNAELVFPTGAYVGPAGGTYGTETVFFPTNELQNPAYTGCQDRTP